MLDFKRMVERIDSEKRDELRDRPSGVVVKGHHPLALSWGRALVHKVLISSLMSLSIFEFGDKCG